MDDVRIELLERGIDQAVAESSDVQVVPNMQRGYGLHHHAVHHVAVGKPLLRGRQRHHLMPGCDQSIR
ncbi:MAG: hypothetical protein IPM07_12905 [Anaerolineales bacterium]|nr:hypothetical protein [Anaerolineales bacterium]